MAIEKLDTKARPEQHGEPVEKQIPNIPREQKIAEANKTRARVDRLRATDDPYEDSARKLAEKEDKFREILKDALKEAKTPEEYIETLADMYSDEALKALEEKKGGNVDGLTGLRNRKALEDEMPGLLKLELREGSDCSVILLDFDDFKIINDTLGHQAGDQALQQLTAIIKGTIRESDLAYRYGGDEFVIFLHRTDLEGALKVAEKIREAVEEAVMKTEGGDLKKTVSVGVACTEQFEEWKGEKAKGILPKLIKKADVAAYQSKKEGRNKVTAAK